MRRLASLMGDEPELSEVIGGGLGEPVKVTSGAGVVKVTLADGRDFIFALDHAEYREWNKHWLARQPLFQSDKEARGDAFGPFSRRPARTYRRR
jgi:hypothetical protein